MVLEPRYTLSALPGVAAAALCGLLLSCALPASAAVLDCGGEPAGIVIRFETFPGAIPAQPGDRCPDTFQCGPPQTLGASFAKASASCDPEAGVCAVQLRFPVTFRGNEENIDEVGLFGAPTPIVYWFAGAADPDCKPWIDVNCGQIAICGVPGAQINADTIETFLQLGSASCANPNPTHAGEFSVMAASCPSRFSCPKRTFDSGGVTPQTVKKGLGCIEPPMQRCNGDAACQVCGPGGAGPGGGPPGVGGPGGGDQGPPTGEGAFLRYAGGGAGHPGYPGSAAWNTTLGRYWSHDYAERLVPFPDETRVFLVTRYATFREWTSPDAFGVYQTVAPSSEYRTLTHLGAGLGWELAELDGTVHAFDGAGLWLSTTDRNGNAKVATYAGSELASVDFPEGTREDFSYHPSGKLAAITKVGVGGAASRVWSYTWTGDDLTRVDRPDGTAIHYHYDEPAYPGYLTRIELEGSDATSVRIERGYEYDASGNVVRTWRGDVSPAGPDAVEVWTYAFDDPEEPTVTTVTDPLGKTATYQLGRDTVSSNVKVLSIDGDCPVCGLGPETQLAYDDPSHPMLPTRSVDGDGTETLMTYDASGRMTSRAEAFGEPEERTTTWEYDTTFQALVTAIERPSVAGGAAVRRTDWALDAAGNATDRTITGVEAGSGFVYTTVTTYNAAGQPLTIDPPGHGAADQTSLAYDPARGSLVAASRTDPIVGTTTFGHDPLNRRVSVTDPNGVETTFSYDALDRVTEVRQKGATPAEDLVTTHEYTVFGDLLRTTLPVGNVIEYGYDTAGRLVSIERKPDPATPGELALYTLDAAGNRIHEALERWDAGAGVWVEESATAFDFSTRCHLDRTVQAPGTPEEAVTEYEYDCNGNLTGIWDPLNDRASEPASTTYTYDALDRLLEVSQPWGGAGGGTAETAYAYDVQDHLVAVTDAEGNTTTYAHSDRDLLTEEVSPASGTTTHAYDEHGELVATTDARGVAVVRTVDAADRVTFVDYPDDSLDTTYAYDAAPAACAGASFPVGRLGSITRGGLAVDFCYDRFGRTTKDGELTFTLDANGNRTGIDYPGGVSASYGFDFADREASLTVTSPGGAETVVSAAAYLPSGPLASLALGNGLTETRSFDGRYAPEAIGLASSGGGPSDSRWEYTTDPVGNVLGVVETIGCAEGPLVLQNQTVTTTETVAHCTEITAGPAFRIGSPGDVRFEASGRIVLANGFSVGAGGRFAAATSAAPPTITFTYTYQDVQYFLTGAVGPWGDLAWTYDTIGNRLSETRGAFTDSYAYVANGSSGNTPILDQVALGVGGVRDYTWGPAGHLEEVAAGANVIDFTSDDEGRLASVSRLAGAEAAVFSYDGRSYLGAATTTAGGTASTEPVYDSGGLLHLLRRTPSPGAPDELLLHLYLAGRPVAQLAIDGAGAETWTYLTSDHLGTPLLATDAAGALVWDGGFEPFGRDWQAGTSAGASENGIYLRLPGQWDDGTWQEASSGAGVYYNVHRWYQPGVGSYSRPDPLNEQVDPNRYYYAAANPIRFFDPLGLLCQLNPQWRDCLTRILGFPVDQVRVHDQSAAPGLFTGGAVFTLPGKIFLPGKCSDFWSDPWLVLHEYFHVIDQWDTGRMTLGGYLFEGAKQIPFGRDPHADNRFEQEANFFADTHEGGLEDCLGCAPLPPDPPVILPNPCPPGLSARTRGMIPAHCR